MWWSFLKRFFLMSGTAAIVVVFVNSDQPQQHQHQQSTSDSASNIRHGAKRNLLGAAASADLISQLPGLHYKPGFRQFSGYLTVSAKNGRNIFYWYVESQRNPATDPVVLWTNGGPGCSGLIGLLQENGPYIVNRTHQLNPNPYSWNKVANMLYIEQPAGTGFSYSKTTTDYDTVGDARIAQDNHQLIREFFKRFPERKSNSFYISGESYAGHYIPQLALELLKNNTGGINFKGMLVGNPAVDDFTEVQLEVGTKYYYSLFPQPLYHSWTKSCATRATYNNFDCNSIYYDIDAEISDGIDQYALNYPVCTEPQSFARNKPGRKSSLRALSAQALQLRRFYLSTNRRPLSSTNKATRTMYQPCVELYATEYLNLKAVRKALHVNETWSASSWSQCNVFLLSAYNLTDYRANIVHLYQTLVNMGKARRHNLSMLLFSGDDDSVVATPATQSWIWSLGVSGKTDQTWVPWTVDNQTAGFVTHFNLGTINSAVKAKFVFATVHGAGHEVPATNPKEALVLFQNYLSRKW